MIQAWIVRVQLEQVDIAVGKFGNEIFLVMEKLQARGMRAPLGMPSLARLRNFVPGFNQNVQ